MVHYYLAATPRQEIRIGETATMKIRQPAHAMAQILTFKDVASKFTASVPAHLVILLSLSLVVAAADAFVVAVAPS